MVVCLQQHEVLGGVPVPDEDVAAVGAAHHELVAPEAGLLYLAQEKHNSTYYFNMTGLEIRIHKCEIYTFHFTMLNCHLQRCLYT